MKPITLIAVLIISIALIQAKDKSNKESGNVEQTLMRIEQEIDDAGVKGDTSPSEKYIADNATFTDPGGMIMDKARSIDDFKSGNLKIESSKLEDMKVQVYGNTAVVTYGTTDKGSYKGKDISSKYRWTDVFVKRNGRWQIVAGQGTRVAQQYEHCREIQMRTILQKFMLGTVITVTGVFAADNSLGTWKLNMEKSKFTPSAPVKSLTATREVSDDGVKVTMTGERAHGTPINGSYKAKYDGKEYPVTVTGTPYDSIAREQVNANSFTTTQKNSGTKYDTTSRAVISKDGKTMTVTMRGTATDGNPLRNTMVYQKQ